jgi:hypothetical protein
VASADTLTERMDALAEALRAAGVPPDRIANILGSAAKATMHALVLDAVLEENARPRPRPVADGHADDDAPLRRAA